MTDKGQSAAVCPVDKLTANAKCRNTKYPRSNIDRFHVPDDKVDWTVDWPEYRPPTLTLPGAIGKPWSDPEHSSGIQEDCWNKCVDNINRVSHIKTYTVDEHGPRNPVGRTGIRGRGCLGRWGPNHAADPIVTRWKRDDQQEKVKHPVTLLPILQFIAIQRRDTKEWAIPGGMIDPGELVSETLKREFGEETMNSLEANSEKKEKLKTQVAEFFKNGSEIYRGYVDDPRNTDNSWMETIAYHFHDEDGTSVGQFQLHAGDDAVGVQWMDISNHMKLYASHNYLIRDVVDRLKADW